MLECLDHLGLKMTSDYLLNLVNFSAYFLDHPSMAIFQEKPIIHYSIRYFATNQLLQFYIRNSRNFKSCFHLTLFSQNVTDMLNENIFFDAQALLIKNLFQLTPVCPSAAASIMMCPKTNIEFSLLYQYFIVISILQSVIRGF